MDDIILKKTETPPTKIFKKLFPKKGLVPKGGR